LKIVQYMIKNTARKVLSGLIAAATLLGGYSTIEGFFDSSKDIDIVKKEILIPEYSETNIPLVYSDISKFKNFLKDNIGNVVKINSQISFDTVLPESILAYQACDFDDFIRTVEQNPSDVGNITLGLPEFSTQIKDANLDYVYDNKLKKEVFVEDTYGLVKCLDQIRIVVKDPRSLRFSYGGTGTMSLPLWGKFLVERRAYSGPSTEYTIREL